jgi:hypothetical protein
MDEQHAVYGDTPWFVDRNGGALPSLVKRMRR